jgi:hypothetical protein
VLHQPSAAMALDGGWQATMRCNTGTHLVAEVAQQVRAYDPRAKMMVFASADRSQLTEATYTAEKVGAI